MRTEWSAEVDPAFPYAVRPAYRRDPHPLPPFSPSCIAVWCCAVPLGALAVALALVRVALFVFSLIHPSHLH